MIVAFKGRVSASPAALTLLVDGVEIHSGPVGSAVPLETETDLVTLPITAGTESNVRAVSIVCTSGVVSVGPVFDATITEGMEDWRISNTILINGVPPEWPITPIPIMPKGTPEDPDWGGWAFELSAGESLTYDITKPYSPPPKPPKT